MKQALRKIAGNFRWLSRKSIRGQSGQVLITALIIFAFGAIIIAVMLSSVSSALIQGSAIEKRNAQLYLADGGIEQVVHWLNNPDKITVATLPVHVNEYSSLPLATSNNINYKAYIVYLGLLAGDEVYQVTSYAGPNIQDYADPSTPQTGPYTRIIARVVPAAAGGILFDNVIEANSAVNVSTSGASITGNVFVQNGALSLPSHYGFTMNGNVYAQGGITGKGTVTGDTVVIGPGGSISGNVSTPNATPSYSTETFVLPSAEMSALRTTIIDRASDVTEVAPGPPWTRTSAQWTISTANETYEDEEKVQGNLRVTATWGTITFNGPVYVNGNMTLNSNSNVVFNGPVTGNGTLSLGGSGDVTFNSDVSAGYITKSSSGSHVFNGKVKVIHDFTLSSGSGNPDFHDTVYIGGDLTAAAGYVITLPDALYIGGNLTLTAGSYIKTTPTSPYKDIVVDGDITTSGGTSVGNVDEIPLIICLNASAGGTVYAAIYAPNSTATFVGGASLNGAIIADTVNLPQGGPRITYNPDLANRTDFPGSGSSSGSGEASITTWNITTS
jgi:hypothetical protein